VILAPTVHVFSTKHIVEILVAVPKRVRVVFMLLTSIFIPLQSQVYEDGKAAPVAKRLFLLVIIVLDIHLDIACNSVEQRNVLVSEQTSNVIPRFVFRVLQSTYCFFMVLCFAHRSYTFDRSTKSYFRGKKVERLS